MAEWRQVGRACPIDGSVGIERCSVCRFFRGVQSLDPVDGKFRGWKIQCVWPRDGRWTWERPIPDSFTAAFETPDEAAVRADEDAAAPDEDAAAPDYGNRAPNEGA